MRTRDDLIQELTQEDLEKLLSAVDEADYRVDPDITDRIRRKALDQIKPAPSKNTVIPLRPLRRLAAALFVVAALSLLSPQVQATMRRLISLIPGIGVVETGDGPILLARDVEVTAGEALTLGTPVIRTAKGGIQLTLQIREQPSEQRDERLTHLQAFTLKINGQPIQTKPLGIVTGGESHSVYQVYIQATAKAGDRVTFANGPLGIEVEGQLQSLASQDPLNMAQVQVQDLLIIADSVKSATGWELYVHALSDKVMPVSFVESYDFSPPLVFETPTGEQVPVEAPTSYGTGFMPPLTLKTEASKGELVIPAVSWRTGDTAEYTFQIPEEGEVVRPGDGFTLAGFPIQVETIRRSQEDPDQIQLELSWTNGQLSLGWFAVDGPSSMTLDDGRLDLTLDRAGSLLGRQTIHFDSPELTWHEELRLPLDLSDSAK